MIFLILGIYRPIYATNMMVKNIMNETKTW